MPPKVQFFILADHPIDYSIDEIQTLSNEYNRIDILLLNPNKERICQYLTRVSCWTNVYIHICYSTIASHLNQLIDLDCNFYCVSTSKKDFPTGFVHDLDEYLMDDKRYLMLIKPSKEWSGMVVNTLLSRYLCHFGQQSIQEKITIHLINHEKTEMFFESVDDFYKKAALAHE